jgi:hypothetical protein
MVDISDFNFTGNFALENQLPFSATGYIRSSCDGYAPPGGYEISSCAYVGTIVIGGDSYTGVSKVTVSQVGVATTNNMAMAIGAIAVVVAGILVIIGRKPSRKRF